jgi:glutamyl-tRNA synthetase
MRISTLSPAVQSAAGSSLFYTFLSIESDVDLEETVRKYALQNAVQFSGKATMGSVLGKVMAENPDLRQKAKDVSAIAKDVIAAVNRLTPEQQKSASRNRTRAPREEGAGQGDRPSGPEEREG